MLCWELYRERMRREDHIENGWMTLNNGSRNTLSTDSIELLKPEMIGIML